MLRRLLVSGIICVSPTVAHPPLAAAQGEIISAIAGTLIPALSKEVEKFWKPKQSDNEVKAKQAEFDKAAQEVRKQTLAPFAVEAENIARVREAFDVAQLMEGAAAGLAVLSAPRLLNSLKASQDVSVKNAFAAEFYQHWLSLKPLFSRAQALSAAGIEPGLRADLQRDVNKIQLAIINIEARLNIPVPLQDTIVVRMLVYNPTGGDAERLMNAMSQMALDIKSLNDGIADLALLLSVRAAAYEDAIRKATMD